MALTTYFTSGPFVTPANARAVLVRPSDNKIWDDVAVGWIAAPGAPGAFSADVLLTGSSPGVIPMVTWTVDETNIGTDWYAMVYDVAAPNAEDFPVDIRGRTLDAADIEIPVYPGVSTPTMMLAPTTNGRTWLMESRAGGILESRNIVTLTRNESGVLLAWDCAGLLGKGEYLSTMTLPVTAGGLSGVTVDNGADSWGNDARYAKCRVAISGAAPAQEGYIDATVETSYGSTLVIRGKLETVVLA